MAPRLTGPTGPATGLRLLEAGQLAGAERPSGREKPKNARTRVPLPLSLLLLLKLRSGRAFHSYDIPHERASEKREHDDGDGLTKRGGGGRA